MTRLINLSRQSNNNNNNNKGDGHKNGSNNNNKIENNYFPLTAANRFSMNFT